MAELAKRVLKLHLADAYVFVFFLVVQYQAAQSAPMWPDAPELGQCPIHEVALTGRVSPVDYGPSPSPEDSETRARLFPYAGGSIYGGREYGQVFLARTRACRGCTAAEEEWLGDA